MKTLRKNKWPARDARAVAGLLLDRRTEDDPRKELIGVVAPLPDPFEITGSMPVCEDAVHRRLHAQTAPFACQGFDLGKYFRTAHETMSVGVKHRPALVGDERQGAMLLKPHPLDDAIAAKSYAGEATFPGLDTQDLGDLSPLERGTPPNVLDGNLGLSLSGKKVDDPLNGLSHGRKRNGHAFWCPHQRSPSFENFKTSKTWLSYTIDGHNGQL